MKGRGWEKVGLLSVFIPKSQCVLSICVISLYGIYPFKINYVRFLPVRA